MTSEQNYHNIIELELLALLIYVTYVLKIVTYVLKNVTSVLKIVTYILKIVTYVTPDLKKKVYFCIIIFSIINIITK